MVVDPLIDMDGKYEINPNNIIFVCILLACNHAGLLDEGCK